MEVIAQVKEMQQRAEALRSEKKIIALVPTMGYLHEGHLSLMREGRKRGDVLIISIFVNPTQFAPGEDYETYPQNMERDLRLIQEVGGDIVFNPTAREMYPDGFQTHVEVETVTTYLCGITRPHHFRGVTTVVAKLFNIVRPHLALFGNKDYQQSVVIKRMVSDLNMDIDVVSLPTVREPDGLAMSSRNAYLNPDERKAARCLWSSLRKGQDLFRHGTRSAELVVREVRRVIEAEPLAQIDYVTVGDPQTLEDITEINNEAIIAVAVKIGSARLIDNIMLKKEV